MIVHGNELEVGDLVIRKIDAIEFMNLPLMIVNTKNHSASYNRTSCIDSCGNRETHLVRDSSVYEIIRRDRK